MFNDFLSRARRRVRKERYKRAVQGLSQVEFVKFFDRFNTPESDWPILLQTVGETGLLRIQDTFGPESALLLARSTRVELYQQGVAGRLKHLWREYLVDEIDISPGDLVVDIGANIGEFSLAARRFGASTFSIEPDPTEFRALEANCGAENILNCALWNEPGEMTFYSKNESGDSSLLEPSDYSKKINVETKTLNMVHREMLRSAPIKLLKIEAEGAEPEIIEAGSEALAAAEYVTVDVGPERGLAQENTVAPVLEALRPYGFRLKKFGNVRFVMLLSR